MQPVIVHFNGFVVEIFPTDSGNLGITVEMDGQENPIRDIFVERDTLSVHSL